MSIGSEPETQTIKVQIFDDKIGYVGYVISTRGVEKDPFKVETVTT